MTDEAMEVEEPQGDLMAELSAAWDAIEGVEDDDTTTVSEQSEPNTAVAEPEAEHKAAGGSREPSGVAAKAEQEPSAQATEQSSVDEAPRNLPAEARESWKDAPPALKAYIKQFDQRMDGLQQKYQADVQRVQNMDKVMAPYQQLFAMNGGPQNVMPGLLRTAATLQMGSNIQKAELVANLVKQFGVDIKALDSALVGKGAPPEVQQNDQLEQILNQKLAPLQQQLQTYQQREQMMQQQEQQKIASELEQFAASREFYQELRHEMADIMHLAAQRGVTLSLEEAYDRACKLNPAIAQVIETRQVQQTTQNKRRAASSISGSPAGVTTSAAPTSTRAAIEAAWDNVGRV